MKMIAAVVGLGLVASALGSCPDSCSGHGTCGANDKCSCFARWGGANCGTRQCPYGLSWVATTDDSYAPAGGNLGGKHGYESCSSRGLCGEGGECQCFPGYEGRGCRRTTCPNSCSGHGRCLYNDEIDNDYPDFVDFNSQHWDGHMTRQCVCDHGYQGFDCSERMCPKGDDPLTGCNSDTGTSQNDVQMITIGQSGFAAGFFALKFTDMYNGDFTTRPIYVGGSSDAPATTEDACADIANALMELPNFVVPNVTKSHSGGGASDYVCKITFVDAANSGEQDTMVALVGSQHDDANYQPRFVTMSGTIVISHDTSSWGADDEYEEHVECSNRGNCDHSLGVCTCYAGYTGEACHLQTVFF